MSKKGQKPWQSGGLQENVLTYLFYNSRHFTKRAAKVDCEIKLFQWDNWKPLNMEKRYWDTVSNNSFYFTFFSVRERSYGCIFPFRVPDNKPFTSLAYLGCTGNIGPRSLLYGPRCARRSKGLRNRKLKGSLMIDHVDHVWEQAKKMDQCIYRIKPRIQVKKIIVRVPQCEYPNAFPFI